ncbi:LPS-induced tumor necrosis factor alpha factor [Penicillium argentinense]|uniref:LPS-induced tumor necrosis factor alpha factor n=1 Tax=Penicillium argentinense TaxID=1131581 RepID=A0A9W9EWV8_9EURO|nr:LPS-induced tumor necrosis factor alpha factor [Penicillium argentinense]KAJ5089472.1 LPS-induced tumor necrosis factor alpha factor [Penicillium argentinense]
MDHHQKTTQASQGDAVESTVTANSTTPVNATTTETVTANTTTLPAVENVPPITAETQPPRYEEHKEIVPAPAPAVAPNTINGPPTEKTAWQAATQAPAPPAGQGLVARTAVELSTLDEEPRLINCPFCYQQTMTRVNKESTGSTGMAAVACCLFGGICCAFIPYCFEMCHDSHHFCTNCGQQVAMRPHDGPVQVYSPQAPVVSAPGHVQAPKVAAVAHDTSGKN